jgi:FkbM family methyltransferase
MAELGRVDAVLKNSARTVINRFGLDIVRYRSPNTIEGHLHRLLPSLGVNCVLDVGAHHGEYAGLLRRIGYRGSIVSFEPVSTNFAVLQRARRRDPRWQGMQFALGAEQSVMAINVLAATDLSSFLAPTPHAHTWFGDASRVVRTEMVHVKCLDDVIEACTEPLVAPRIFLKIDAQGFDLSVLQGATRTLQWVVGLQTEIAVRSLYEDVSLFPDNVVQVLALGFDLTGLFGVAREPDGIAQIEFDCVMRRPHAWLADAGGRFTCP